MQDITPFLWFNDNAEEAVNFYVSLFGDAEIRKVKRTGASLPGKEGAVFSIEFTIKGQEFIAMNGGPMYQFSEAISFFVDCEDQKEVDYFWEKLTSGGGEESMCGWLKDKFGISWQIVPKALPKLMNDKDGNKAKRVMQAMMKMRKIIVADLEKAYEGK